MTDKEKTREQEVQSDEHIKKNMKASVLTGAFWLFMEKGGLSIVEFVVSLILARLLMPEDYATVGLIAIFVNFSNIFVQGGFNTALVQRKEIDDDDCSTVFWMSLVTSVLLYLVLFFSAPLIASFYGKEILVPILRVQAITLVFGALSVVQTALLTRKMQFKKIFVRTSLATVFSAVLGIGAALMGLGAWTIVIQTLTVSVVGCITMWFSVKWRPKLVFSVEKLKRLFGFGSKILASNLINCAYSNTLPIVMEKLYAGGTLGYYNKSRTLPEKLGESVNSTVSNVVFPSLSKYQNEPERVKALTRRFIVTSSFVMFAIMGGLIAVAHPLIVFLYTEKWVKSAVFMQFVCVSYAFMPLNSANLQAIKALGRSDIYLKLEMIKNSIGIVLLAAAMFFTRGMESGLYVVLAVQAFISLLCVLINAFPNKKLMGYSFVQQVRDVMPSLVLAVVMCAAVYSVSFLNLPNIVTLLIQVPLGAAVYIGGAYAFKLECLSYITATLKEFIHKKRTARKNTEGGNERA